MAHRTIVVKASRTVGPSITDVVSRESWRGVKIHDVSVARYRGKGTSGTKMLQEELEAEYEGVKVPSIAGWLVNPDDVHRRHRSS